MLVKELILELSKYPEDLEVVDGGYMNIDTVREGLWVDGNFPYDKPDKIVVVIE